jgi:hypothetical protein
MWGCRIECRTRTVRQERDCPRRFCCQQSTKAPAQTYSRQRVCANHSNNGRTHTKLCSSRSAPSHMSHLCWETGHLPAPSRGSTPLHCPPHSSGTVHTMQKGICHLIAVASCETLQSHLQQFCRPCENLRPARARQDRPIDVHVQPYLMPNGIYSAGLLEWGNRAMHRACTHHKVSRSKRAYQAKLALCYC